MGLTNPWDNVLPPSFLVVTHLFLEGRTLRGIQSPRRVLFVRPHSSGPSSEGPYEESSLGIVVSGFWSLLIDVDEKNTSRLW